MAVMQALRVMTVAAIGIAPAIARIGIARSVVLAIGVGIELGALARIVDDVLGRSGGCKRQQQGGGEDCQSGHGEHLMGSRITSLRDKRPSCRVVPFGAPWLNNHSGNSSLAGCRRIIESLNVAPG